MDEQIDILTSFGDFTGEIAPRKDVHKKGLWHRASGVIIVNEDAKILSQQRSKNKDKNAGLWDLSASGHIPAGEMAIDSLVREISEELGIDVKKEELNHLGTYVRKETYNQGTFIENEFDDIYILFKDVKLSEIKVQESEVDDVRYFSIEEFKSLLKEGKAVKRENVWEDIFKFVETYLKKAN